MRQCNICGKDKQKYMIFEATLMPNHQLIVCTSCAMCGMKSGNGIIAKDGVMAMPPLMFDQMLPNEFIEVALEEGWKPGPADVAINKPYTAALNHRWFTPSGTWAFNPSTPATHNFRKSCQNIRDYYLSWLHFTRTDPDWLAAQRQKNIENR